MPPPGSKQPKQQEADSLVAWLEGSLDARRERLKVARLLPPDVIAEISDYFQERIDYALGRGVKKEKIILDPGIGFGKRLEDNVAIIRNLRRFAGFDLPLLVGVSRKSFLGLLGGEKVPEKREAETIAANLVAARNGAAILRVHDVAATVKALKVWRSLAE